MRKSKYSESQIAAILKEAEAGMAVADIARKHGISAATFYQWRSKYGGMSVSDMQRLRELEQENGRLKRMYADLSLDHELLKEVLAKVLTPAQRRETVGWLMDEKATSERRACRVMRQGRTTQRRVCRGRMRCDAKVETRLIELAKTYPAWGCPMLHQQLRQEGHRINHKRTERLYRTYGLALRRRRRRRLPERARIRLIQPVRPNQCWSMDFMSDSLASGRAYRTFNVLDDYARDALAIEIDISLTANRVIRVLEQLCESHGTPEAIRSDNGPEFRSDAVQTWAKEKTSAGTSSSRVVRLRTPTSNASTAPTDARYSTRISSGV